MNSYEKIYNLLTEAKTPERHAADITNKALSKHTREREAFEKSGGKAGPESHPDYFDPASKHYLKDTDFEKKTSAIVKSAKDVEELRKKRLTTQLTLKDRLRKARVATRKKVGSGEEQIALNKRIARMHAAEDARGGNKPKSDWRGQDETDAAQERGQAYPGGPETSMSAPYRGHPKSRK